MAVAAQESGKWVIYRKRADGVGTEDLLAESDDRLAPSSWSSDGALLFYTVENPKTGRDIWVQPIDGGKPASPVLNSPANESHPQISPDGHWIAYQSDESGRTEVYVQSFPLGRGKWQVSADRAQHPRWRVDNRKLYYTDGPTNFRRLVSLDLAGRDGALQYRNPHVLFEFGRIGVADPLFNLFDVSRDGQRFLLPRADTNLQGETVAAPMTVVLHWTALLQK